MRFPKPPSAMPQPPCGGSLHMLPTPELSQPSGPQWLGLQVISPGDEYISGQTPATEQSVYKENTECLVRGSCSLQKPLCHLGPHGCDLHQPVWRELFAALRQNSLNVCFGQRGFLEGLGIRKGSF